MKTLTDAVDFASGLATGLRQYFQLVMAIPDRAQTLPAYMDERSRTAVYVQPDVLKRERRAEPFPPSERRGREAEGERGSEESEQAPRTTVAPEARDVGEEMLYGERERETERRVAWVEERRELERGRERRAVVLAPPGQGKSLLAQMTAREVAQQSLESLTNQRSGVDGLPLPIVLTLNDLAKRGIKAGEAFDHALRESLTAALVEMDCLKVAADYLAEHAREDRCWLFLDALDEVDDHGRQMLAQLFEALKEWQCRLIITSRPYGYEGWRFPFDLAEYRLAPFSSEQQQEFVEKWFEEEEGRDRMTRLLTESPAVQQVGQNPLLLTLLCSVVGQGELSPEITRTQLYDRVVRDVLGLPPGESGEVDEERAEDWLPLLGEMALRFFQENAGRGPMPSGEVLTLFAGSAQRPALLGRTLEQTESLTPRQQAHYLLEELRRKRLLVPLAPDRASYVLPHRSILEYLTAYALAREEPDVLRRLVDKKAWHPDWEQVIIFLAGRLAHSDDSLLVRLPVHDLLSLLADEKKDDVFRHRLALAAQCLPEIPVQMREPHSGLIDHITTAVFSLWWEHEWNMTSAAVQHLSRALPALGQVNGRTPDCLRWGRRIWSRRLRVQSPVSLLDSLLRLLVARDLRESPVREVLRFVGAAGPGNEIDWIRRRTVTQEMATKAMKLMGTATATPEFLDELADLLSDEDAHVRQYGLRAVAAIGTLAARSDVVDRIAELLRDEDEDVRRAAGLAAYAIATPTAGFLDRLAQLLRDEDVHVRAPACWVVAGMGTLAARSDIVDRIAELLRDEDEDVRRAAALAVAAMGASAARSDIVDRIAELLRDEGKPVRQAATEAVAAIGTSAARPDVVDRFAELLRDEDRYVREAAAEAVAAIRTLVPEFFDRLAQLLRDEDHQARQGGLEVAARIGAPAARSDIVDRIAELLRDEDAHVRWEAAEALAAIATLTPEFLDRLAQLFRNGDVRARESVCQVVRRMGTSAARSDIVDRIAELLRDEDAGVRWAAAEAVVAIRTPAPEFLDRLAELLRDEDEQLRRSGLLAIKQMGTPAGRSDIVDRMAELLRDEDAHVRWEAAEAVGALGAQAATPEILDRIARLLSHGDSWEWAWQMVQGIGAQAATPEILDGIARLLRKGERLARPEQLFRGEGLLDIVFGSMGRLEIWRASQMVEGIGGAAARPDIVDRLVRLVGRGHAVTAEAVGGIQTATVQAVRICRGRKEKWEARTVAELSA